jgi:RNA polymerase sigma-B factor
MTDFPHAAWSMTEEPVMRVTAWTVPAEVLPVPAGRLRQDLEGLENGKLLVIVRSLPRGNRRREAACDVLVSRHSGLVRSCVRRYSRSPGLFEDLMQVGYVGLMKAISNFDPAIGGSLAAYAQPSITGEIKKHFRDKHWPVHVGRQAQELMLEVRSASGQLAQDLGRMPAESDVARHLGVSGEALRSARRAEMALQPGSLDAPMRGGPGAVSLADVLGDEDPRMDHMLAMQAVAAHWNELSPRERNILVMRYYGDMSQVEIGRQLGLSQMHISRLLTRALEYLRPRVFG